MYVYRFLDKQEEVIYIGKTNSLEKRMRQHKVDGHLSRKAYDEVRTVEYISFESEIDQYLGEIFLINKYRPKYNSSYLGKGECSIRTNILEDWKIYSHDGENVRKIENQIGTMKKRLRDYQSEITKVKSLLARKRELEEELEETERKILSKKNNPHDTVKKNCGLVNIKEQRDGWYTSNTYNKLRGERITVVKEKGEILSLYIGAERLTATKGEKIDFLSELMILEKLLLDWEKI